MLTVACVRTGTKYGPEYVDRLRAMVERNLKVPHRFVCLTDQRDLPQGVERFDVSGFKLPGWWSKMLLFDPDVRGDDTGGLIYFDLDTVIVGDITPLAKIESDFAICANFTRANNVKTWPCRYGSCVMTFAPGFGGDVFEAFWWNQASLMRSAGNKGDQYVIEKLIPKATILQMVLPPGFFLHWRQFGEHPSKPPEGCAVAVYAGGRNPKTIGPAWARTAWRV